eukprot:scaffold4029_cov62-Phaeocystis_antarctica.AAC.3
MIAAARQERPGGDMYAHRPASHRPPKPLPEGQLRPPASALETATHPLERRLPHTELLSRASPRVPGARGARSAARWKTRRGCEVQARWRRRLRCGARPSRLEQAVVGVQRWQATGAFANLDYPSAPPSCVAEPPPPLV